MDFNELRNGILLLHRSLLEKAETSPDKHVKDLYKEAAQHLKEVASHLYKFDQTMKEIKSLQEKGSFKPN